MYGRMSETAREYVINCRECDFVEFAPDFSNADLIRDQHDYEMFNWFPDSHACGPCAIGRMGGFN